MTRLADALERAKGRRGDAVSEPASIAMTTGSSAAPALTLVTPEVESRVSTGASLITIPTRHDGPTAWRTDPELIGKLVGSDGFGHAALEQYRKLAATLHHAQVERGMKVVMTTSALPSEGKSLTAVNTALTLSDSYQRRVLLVDADLRRPTIQRIFGLPAGSGLNEGLTSEKEYSMTPIQMTERLYVLPAGRPDPDPISVLTSARMKRTLAHAASLFDWVIVDTPPLGLLPDASLLAEFVDGVLLVVRCGKAPFNLVKRTVDGVSRDKIIGVIMNAVDLAHDRNAGGYYEYYGYGYYGTPAGKQSGKK
jgi:capsular exopolysaccharide synthesis family protein